MTPKLPLALTLGEPSGIGPELAAKAWRALHQTGPAFFWLGDPALLRDQPCPVRQIEEPEDAASVFAEALPVLALTASIDATLGRPDPANAAAVVESIERAVGFARDGAVAGVVTNPIQKSTLYHAGFSYPGHTEFLAALTGVERSVMMLACRDLRVVPVTVHIPLAAVSPQLTMQAIVETVTITARALVDDFGLAAPRIAVAGLNPHAGEDGAMGLEDRDVVAPAVAALRRAGLDAVGPLPADTMFHARARSTYDVAVCMYHDQALIPLKTLDFDGGVNVTLGLPIVRTSPDHGTALDIAGKGVASARSLIEALRLADQMAGARKRRQA